MAKKTERDGRSNREIIIEQLNTLPGWKKSAGDGWFMVCCPFHDEGTPSCGVRVAEPSLGVFNCFGCGKKGGWNTLAEKAQLEKIKDWNTGESVDAEAVIPKGLDDKLLGSQGLTMRSLIEHFRVPEAMLWPEKIDWRGFPGSFMRTLGAHIFHDTRADTVGALFPVKVGGRVRGGVKAAFVKDANNKRALSYVTSGGHWVSDYGLFPFVYARQLIRRNKYNFLVVVEGPRDAMRLCLNGVPAVAVLGANNISEKKVLFMRSLGIDVIYAIPDPDEAGIRMWRLLKRLCEKSGVESKRLKLPPKLPNGSKLDPGNAPRKVLREVFEFFEQKHDFEIPTTIQ